jgi:hypothetical protein
MKDFITALLIIVLVFALIALCIFIVTHGQKPKDIGENLTNGWYYALPTCVVQVDRDNAIVTCEDSNGNLWEFYGCEDWQEGDCASLLMNSKGTPSVYDDAIEGARYSAWTLTR